MKPLQLITLFLLGCAFTVTAQVKFKVKLLPDNTTYQVLIRPDATWNAPLNATPSAQVTVRVPVGGFQVGAITNLKGTWSNNANVVAPTEAPGYHYIVFGLQGATSAITYAQGVEVAIFNFANSGACTGALELIENGTDPFYPPNSQSVNVGNQISVIGAGIGVNAYTGNYNNFEPNCTPTPGSCGIEVFDVALTSPSACGVADGVISISATTSGGLPLQYSITGLSGAYQSSPTFTGLAAGDIFDIVVRDIAAICIVEVGEFELDGPLAAAITGIDLVDPSCGGSDGSITINAFSENGGVLEYAMDGAGPWQSSSTFSGLPAGTYPLYVQDIVNNCSDFIGAYTLEDCAAPPCLITYELVNLGSGQYEVVMHTGQTWNFPDNITASQQITLKVPTGGFVFENLVAQTPNVGYAVNSTYAAPAEAPGFDYISIGLTSFGTQNIPYINGGTVHLFTFQNGGTCEGDSISLVQNDDPFYPPNAQNANVGQQITISGYGGADVPICISGSGAVGCETLPPPPPPACLVTYELEKLPSGVFQISMTSDTTWTGVNSITSTANYTVKVPTGGFVADNLTSLISGVNFTLAPPNVAPTEDPAHDYISFSLASPGTQGITYQQGLKVPLFTFENSGTCTGGTVFLMDNDTDPFFPPNSQNASVGQQLTVFGYGGPDAPICEVNNAADDCAGCTGLLAAFNAPNGCAGTAIIFTDTTTSIEPVISWSWAFGDGDSSSLQSPSHTYTSSGNFEVSLTVATGSGCTATFTEFVTVFSLPSPVAQDAFSICNGDPAQLQGPADAITFSWSPTTGLSDSSIVNPVASPAVTTVYYVTATNSNGCQITDTVTVTVANKPIINDVTVTAPSDCGLNDASISIAAVGVGGLEYTINNTDWFSTPNFTGLSPGTYTAFVRNSDGSCPVAYNGNPIVITALTAPVISNVLVVQPTGCNSDGAITITASDGVPPLIYSIDGGASWQASNSFTNLGGGTYNPAVANTGESCEVNGNPVTLNQAVNPTISAVADQVICNGTSVPISVTLSENIAAFDILPSTGVSGVNASGNTLTFNLAASGGTVNYTVTLTGLSSCTASEQFAAQEIPAVTAAFSASSPACVNGEITLNFTGAATAASTLTWSLDGGTVISSSAATASAPAGATVIVSYQNSGTKNISLTVAQANCQDIEPSTINITDFNPGANLNTTPVNVCGGANGSIDLTLATPGNYNFQWSGPGVSATTQNLSGLDAGVYNLTITEAASGCFTTASASITAPAPVSINSVTDTPASDCSGVVADGGLSISISGGNAPFTYNIYDAGNPGVPVQTQTSSQTSLTINGLAIGTYQVEVVTTGDCTALTTATVTASGGTLSATLASAQDASCGSDDGQFSVNVAGVAPFTYIIYKNNVATGASQTLNDATLNVNNLEPATYVAVLTDANGCVSQPVVANIASEPGDFGIVATVVNPACGASDGSISLSNMPAGGVFSWSSNGLPFPVQNPLNGLGTGVYELLVIAPSGCTQEISYTLTPAAGPQISIEDLTDASCGNANGGLTFNVSGSGTLYDYEILNSSFNGFGTYGQDVPVTGLAAGAYVVSIQDVNTSCESVEAFVIAGTGGNLQGIAVLSPPTDCGVEDASICVTLSGGAAPYTLTSNLGIAPATPFYLEGCVQGLYEGFLNLVLTDSVGCVLNFTVPLPDQDEPTIDETDLTITGALCPGDSGSIVSNTGIPYEIFNANTFVGITPWLAATPGDYLVVNEIGDCSAEVLVTVSGPPAWAIDVTLDSASCDGDDGVISLEVSGGTAPYTYDWSNDDTTSFIQNLDGNQEFSVTVTDAEGCITTSENLSAGNACTIVPCDDIFFLDTFFVALNPGTTEICLPTNVPNLDIYELELDGQPYLFSLGVCNIVSHFYGYGMLLSLGQPPFKLVEWTYGGNIIEDDIEFNDIQQLVDRMNELDPTGNWILNESQSSISGGTPGSIYASLILNHLASNTEVSLEVNVITEPHPSITVNDDPTHIFIATDLTTGCADTLNINLLPDLAIETDTIEITVAVGDTLFDCLSTTEFAGTPGDITDLCSSFASNALLLEQPNLCFGVFGVVVGFDQACFVVCDDTGICDTTIVLITVTPGNADTSTNLVIYNAFSPNGDQVNDFFTIKNVDLYPDNELIVFNRWGNRVYQTAGYNNEWEGKYDGSLLPDGTYFYMFDVMINEEKKQFMGKLVLRR